MAFALSERGMGDDDQNGVGICNRAPEVVRIGVPNLSTKAIAYSIVMQ